MDIENHRYWVTFDRPGLGKHAIPDTEIKVMQVLITPTEWCHDLNLCLLLTVESPPNLLCVWVPNCSVDIIELPLSLQKNILRAFT